jgi:hypothetical protein
VTSDGTRLIVADSGHNRVLIWNTWPTENGAPADLVVGQGSFTTGGSGLSATAMYSPYGVAATPDALFVADTPNDRILVYSPLPTTSGVAATFVLGQPDLDTGANDPAPTASSLSLPRALTVVGNHLWVADEAHRRLLRYTLYPE